MGLVVGLYLSHRPLSTSANFPSISGLESPTIFSWCRGEEFRVVKWQDMDKAERTERRPLRRIPLSDCTNTGAAAVSEGVRTAKSSTAKSVARPTKPHPSKKRKPEQNSSSRSDTGSNDIRNAPNPSSLNDAVSPPPPKASTPVRASKSSSNLSSGDYFSLSLSLSLSPSLPP